MFKVTLISSAILALSAGAAVAQESQKLERIQVTGSSIKRVESETALPVTVISRDAIEKSGAVNVEDILRRLSVNSGQLSDSTQGAGYATSNANLRGLGANSTLVLLNGRRLAGHPFGSIGGSVAVDLNSIPFAAIERIEVLRDGASAIYGTDAVAGVINFITRKDYDKGELTVRYGAPEKNVGGKEHGGSIAFGTGNLDKDGYNFLVTANIKEQTRLEAVKQAWYSRHATEVPGSLPPTSFRAYPGRLMDIGISPGAYTNPGANMAACDPVNTVIQLGGKVPNGVDDVKRCRAIYAAMLDNLPDSTKTDLFARGTFRIDGDNQWFIEASAARNHTTGRAAPTPIDGTAMKVKADGSYPNVLMPITSKYFPTALLTRLGYTPADYVSATIDGVGYTEIAYRSLDRGNRVSDNTNEQYRVVVGANGLFSGWDYDIGLNVAQARGTLNYSGYLLEEPFLDAMKTGNVNPFGPNDAAGVALLDGAALEGKVRQSKGTTVVLDAKVSRELMKMDGGMMAIAMGVDLRREKADDKPTNAEYSKGSHIGGEGSVPATSASRNISAIYSELSLPFAKGWEAAVAARYDKYSDFGGSFNPRVALRFQPSKEMLFRASAGTGFRAPTLWDVNSPVSNTNTADPQTDPECPQPNDAQGNPPALCNTQFNVRLSSDKNLKPEKSRQFAFGAVFEPIRDLSIAVDYWNIQKKDQIGVISGDTLMAEPGLYAKYKSRVVRNQTTKFISYIETPVENLGELKTSGIDIDVKSAVRLGNLGRLGIGFASTYTLKYELQNGKGLPFTDYTGKSLGGNPPVPEWQHTLSFDWTMGSWNVALENVFTKGWEESAAVVNTNLGVNAPYQVKDTSRWNLAVSYRGFKDLRLTLGARNAFDQDPPFVASSSYGSHAAGFAGSFADPRGRFTYGSVTYQFK
jgi:iron complex outermembrane receptor protein